MIRLLLLLTCLFPIGLLAQQQQEQSLSSKITKVKVFQSGAQVTREAKQVLPFGESQLRLAGLSPYIDPGSIRVRLQGGATLLAVQHENNYLHELDKSAKADSLYALSKQVTRDLKQTNAQLDVLSYKKSLLDKNQELGSRDEGTQLSELKLAVGFYEEQLTSIFTEELEARERQLELQTTLAKIKGQLTIIEGETSKETGEIILKVATTGAGQVQFELDYLVQHAGWVPKYDIRVQDVSTPLSLHCKADVFQNTGIDWKDVQLTLSNADPRERGDVPELSKWELYFKRYGRYDSYNVSPAQGVTLRGFEQAQAAGTVRGRIIDESGQGLPGVNVVLHGTTQGTNSDIDGYFELSALPGQELSISYIGFASQQVQITNTYLNIRMIPDVSMLSEVVVTGAKRGGWRRKAKPARETSYAPAPPPTTYVERQTTVEYEVERAYTVSSQGQAISVDLQTLSLEADYEYYAVPKLDEDAFLIARIPDWGSYNLPQGETNLYFEEGYVGKSTLNTNALTDTLDISLGRDKSIVISREKVETYSQRRTLGSSNVDTRGYLIKVRNRKSQEIKLTIVDQLPVAALSQITVTPTDLGDARYEEQKGELIWEMSLPPQQQKELRFGYEVKYPKREQVVLE